MVTELAWRSTRRHDRLVCSVIRARQLLHVTAEPRDQQCVHLRLRTRGCRRAYALFTHPERPTALPAHRLFVAWGWLAGQSRVGARPDALLSAAHLLGANPGCGSLLACGPVGSPRRGVAGEGSALLESSVARPR